ncbi:hypothetical protein [Bdellovibrio sp. HCB288]|uniref:hypothetical protein n=1 Tax=Bdellovibrio sp. HCB288 TaxID=3394355 RepID=UPI0039B5B1F7
MKKLILPLILVMSCLVACTSDEKSLKKAAEAAAAAQFKSTIEEEAKGYLTQSDTFLNAYVSFMVKFAEFSAEDIKLNGGVMGSATVYITSYPPDVRKGLLKVAATVSPAAVNRFNFANAYQLIAKETGRPGEPMKYLFVVYNLRKDTHGDWVVQK